MQHACDCQQRADITCTVAADDVHGTLKTAGPKPDAAYLMDLEGTVAFWTLWANYESSLSPTSSAGDGAAQHRRRGVGRSAGSGRRPSVIALEALNVDAIGGAASTAAPPRHLRDP